MVMPGVPTMAVVLMGVAGMSCAAAVLGVVVHDGFPSGRAACEASTNLMLIPYVP
jgi:hypothetical protein